MYVDIEFDYSPLRPYFTFSHYVKKRHGCKTGKINLDAKIGCFHREKNGGCDFCDIESFRPGYSLRDNPLKKQWDRGVEVSFSYKKYYGYFQSGTNTAIAPSTLQEMLEEVISFDKIVGVMIGTRVDAINEDTLSILSELGKETEVWLEIGLQSTNEDALKNINRGHSFSQFTKVLNKIEKAGNIYTAAHIIFGLPKENEKQMKEGMKKISTLPLSAVKFHHLQVIKNTSLALKYEREPFKTFSAEEYAMLLVDILSLTNPRFVVERLSGESKKRELIAPRWTISKSDTQNLILKTARQRGVIQGCNL